jgi:hypothetical protein
MGPEKNRYKAKGLTVAPVMQTALVVDFELIRHIEHKLSFAQGRPQGGAIEAVESGVPLADYERDVSPGYAKS